MNRIEFALARVSKVFAEESCMRPEAIWLVQDEFDLLWCQMRDELRLGEPIPDIKDGRLALRLELPGGPLTVLRGDRKQARI